MGVRQARWRGARFSFSEARPSRSSGPLNDSSSSAERTRILREEAARVGFHRFGVAPVGRWPRHGALLDRQAEAVRGAMIQAYAAALSSSPRGGGEVRG